jgi:glycosyltransferase involved in cell wall biosynthesis
MRAVPPESRVAFLSERFDLNGGGQLSLCDLASALLGSPIRPLVVVPRPGSLSEALQRSGVEWVTIPLPPLACGVGSKAITTLVRLRRLVLDRDIDLLHSNTPRTAIYAGCVARLTGRRHVFHVRDARPSSVPADRVLVGLSDRIVAVSRAAAARSVPVRSCRRTRVVLTGLPPIDYLPRPQARLRLNLPQDAFVCGVVGRVEEDRGRNELLTAFAVVHRAVPGAHLVFLGPVDPGDPWTHTVSLRATAMGLSGAVHLAGTHPDAASLLKAFDLLLHASRHGALPRVLIEAQLASLPVVAAAVEGVPEIIESTRSGLLVQPGDAEALGRAAVTLARDPDTRRRLAESGLARARELFGLDRMVSEIRRVYAEILPVSPADRVPPSSRRGRRGRTREAIP